MADDKGSSPTPWQQLLRRTPVRLGGVALLIGVLLAIASQLNLRPNLDHLDAGVLSGGEQGNYYALVGGLATEVQRRGGSLRNIATAGSQENASSLSAAADRCDAHYALVQAGLTWPEGAELELLGALPKSESLMLLGREGDAVDRLAALRGKRVGIGPKGSGSAQLARVLFESDPLSSLALRLSNHPVVEQLELAAKGELDFALLVIDEDAALVQRAVREMGLQVVDLDTADVIARRYGYLRKGRIGAGQYDPVRRVPHSDKRVLRVDTLLVANGCTSRSERVAMLVAVNDRFPDFIDHNRTRPNRSGLPLAAAAHDFFLHGGPELVDEHAPWAVDIMPPSNWVHVALIVSVLFNFMGFVHRFRLWRLDAARVDAEQLLWSIFGPGTTIGDIEDMDPEGELADAEAQKRIEKLLGKLQMLARRCREQSTSMFAPMGQEMSYRYQESLINREITELRAYLRRCRGEA
jgi:TRAP-type uncharacterized transport system substrate-binding protein